MEIQSYGVRLRVALKRHRAWIAILVVVPVLAGVATAAFQLARPREYRATATVVVASGPVVGSQIAATDQAVADFQGAIASQLVASAAARAAGTGASAVEKGVSVERLSSSGVVEVSYVSTSPDVARAVVLQASRRALSFLQQSVVRPLAHQRDLAQDAYAQAEADYQAFLSETGFINPQQVFRIQTSRLVALRDELGHAVNSGDEQQAAELRDLIESKQTKLTQDVVEYQRLQDARQRSLSALTAADNAFYEATGRLASATAEDSVAASPARPLGKLARLPRALVGAVVIGFLLALGLVALLEALSHAPVVAAESGGAVIRPPSGATTAKQRRRARSSSRRR